MMIAYEVMLGLTYNTSSVVERSLLEQHNISWKDVRLICSMVGPSIRLFRERRMITSNAEVRADGTRLAYSIGVARAHQARQFSLLGQGERGEVEKTALLGKPRGVRQPELGSTSSRMWRDAFGIVYSETRKESISLRGDGSSNEDDTPRSSGGDF
nr:hypothetical protein CFP56_12362 [Quercus suber]